VSVTLAHDRSVVGTASGRGYGRFIFPTAPDAVYVVRTSGQRGGRMHTTNGVQTYINLFSHCA